LTQFTDLGLSKKLLDAVTQEGYTIPTPIQAQTIPALLEGKDLLGIAQTGTGKTAAFALPILELLSRHTERVARGTCRALILSPTRELAAQIGESFKTYGKYMKASRAVVFGGTSIGKQVEACRNGVDILVATPGRLVDLIERRAISLNKVEIFVLDEVDQMLDLGFIHAIRRITALLPRQRQNLFFSATMPKEIAGLAAGLLTNPVRIEVAPVATTVERVNQSVIHVDQAVKLALLIELLKDNNMTRTLVFTRTKHGADKVVRGLAVANYTVSAIHGNKSQANREKALAGFKAGKILVLVATDIAARGIDVEGVSHVINFDLPHVPESYVHRIGRTARAGAEGQAIALCAADERSLLRDIERTIRMPIPVAIHALGKAEVPQGGKEPARRPNGRAMAPKDRAPRAERSAGDRPRSDRPQGGKFHRGQSDFADKPKFEKPVHEKQIAQKREMPEGSKWTPLAGEPTIMYQKPKPREEKVETRDTKPWFKQRSGNGENRGGNTRGRSFGDKPRGDFAGKPHGDRDSNPRSTSDSKPWSNHGDAPKRDFAENRSEVRGETPRRDFNDKPRGSTFGDKPRGSTFGDKPRGSSLGDKPREFNADRPRGNFGDKPRGNFGDKPRGNFGDKPRGNFTDKPTGERSFGDKPRGNFGDKPRGKFSGGKPGGFAKPSGGNFKRKERAEG
jgi:ATP-dependent RNA helicase RhlE